MLFHIYGIGAKRCENHHICFLRATQLHFRFQNVIKIERVLEPLKVAQSAVQRGIDVRFLLENEHLFTHLYIYRVKHKNSYHYITGAKICDQMHTQILTFKKTLLHFAEEKCSLRF